MATIQVKRGTLAQLDAAAGSSGLRAGEPYLVTDVDGGTFAVGTSTTGYKWSGYVTTSQAAYDALTPVPGLLYVVVG